MNQIFDPLFSVTCEIVLFRLPATNRKEALTPPQKHFHIKKLKITYVADLISPAIPCCSNSAILVVLGMDHPLLNNERGDDGSVSEWKSAMICERGRQRVSVSVCVCVCVRWDSNPRRVLIQCFQKNPPRRCGGIRDDH
jgi:hypothetical protein